jgi:PKD repeat protein
MKNVYTYLRCVLFLVLTSLVVPGMISRALAQGCNQVEIGYEQPDCFKRKGGPDAGGQGKNCTPITVCEDQPYTYSATGGPWASYLWTITSGPATPPINPSATVANVTVNWPVPGTYILTLTVTDAGGNTFTKCLEVTVKEKPDAKFGFAPNNACAGSTINFFDSTVYSGTAYYSWDFGDPLSGSNTSNLQNPSHTYATAGTYVVTLVAYSSALIPNNNSHGGDSMTLVTCCADTVKHTVTIVNGNVKIECISTVCAGTKATYTAVGCSLATWGTPVGGTVVGTTSNTITVLWGNGNPQGQLSVSCGGCTAYATVPIVPTNPVIMGNLSPCMAGQTSYSVPYLPGTFYTWTLTNLSSNTTVNNLLSTYPDNNTVLIDWSTITPGDSFLLTINLNNPHLCCNSTGSIKIKPKQTFSISGPPIICAGQPVSFGANQIDTFFWKATPVAGVVPPILGGAGFYTATFNNPGTYVITATNTTSFCNTTASANAVVVAVPTPDTIVGPVVACVGSQYGYSMSGAAPSGYFYEWTISGGTFEPGALTTTSGNSVSALWGSLPGTIIVYLKRSTAPFCSRFADSVQVIAATPGAVSGNDSTCVDGTSTYSIIGGNLPSGTTITWNITPPSLGTILSGQGTGSVNIIWHGAGGSGPWGPATVSASTGCGPVTPLTQIYIFPKFLVNITAGGTNVCLPGGVSLTANGAPANASYLWTPGNLTTQTISNITTFGTYTVTATAGGCSSTVQFDVPDPFAIIPVTCGVGFCSGTATNELLGVQVLKPGSGTFTYAWHSGTCTSPGPTLATTTTTSLSNNFTAPSDGNYCVFVTYGSCQKCLNFVVKKVCCPDTHSPTVTATQNTCDTWTFVGTASNTSGVTVMWDFGDNTTDTGSSGTPKTHTYTAAGIYCVTFCIGPPTPNTTNCTGNCAATQAIVPIAPEFLYTLGCNGCLNLTNITAVYDPSGIVTYLWNFGDATTSTLQNPPQHCYAAGGTYTVTLTVTWTKGTITCTKVVSHTVVYTPLQINVSDSCTGSPITFSSTPSGFVFYTWSFGDTYTGYISPITHAYSFANTYQVILTVQDILGNTCKDTSMLNVVAGISNCTIQPGYICPGQSATLTAPSGPYTYQWYVETSPNVFVIAPGLSTDSNYTTNVVGNYQVVMSNANGCICKSNVVSVTAVTNPKASFTISPSKRLCAPGGLVIFSAPIISGFDYKWYMNGVYGTQIGAGANFAATVTMTTTFNLIVTNQYGCRDTCSQVVTVSPLPAPPVISSTGTCAGVPITLSVTNYFNHISWNNGANTTSIVVFAAGTYVATYTDSVTGCSSSSLFTINKRPSAGLFPHHCDSIPCKCTRPFVIYAPNPLIGAFASTYVVNWYNAANDSLLFTGPTYNNGGKGVPTGSYYIVITDGTTGCKDTSNDYSIVVPKCDTCSCDKSMFTDVLMTPVKTTGGGTGAKALVCDSTYIIPCSTAYVIKPFFRCNDTACKSKITYVLQPPSGAPTTGTDSINFNGVQSGIYTLTIYGWCGNKPCDSCIIKFRVSCTECNCKGSKWGPIVLTQFHDKVDTLNAKAVISNPPKLQCGKTYKIDCNKPYNVSASFSCKDTNCKGFVTYSLQPPVGVAITGTGPVNFTPTLSGVYTLTLYGWCGNVKCDSCVIYFEVGCGCDCKDSKWKDIVLTETVITDNPVISITNIPNNPPPVSKKLACGKDYVLECGKTYSINAGFQCKDTNCIGKVMYVLQPPTGAPQIGTLPFNLTPILSGTYTLTLYGWCGNKICDSCVIRFKVDCSCDCKQSKWSDKTLWDGVSEQKLNCKTYQWSCNQPVGINASYACAKDYCSDTATYKLIPPSGPAVTGNLPLYFAPSVSGNYTVIIYGYCGGKLCDSCVSVFKVDCPKDTGCCKYPVRVTPGTATYSSTSSGNATVASQIFTVSGLTGVQLSEVRAEVMSYNIGFVNSNCDTTDCTCLNLPFTWASINSASNIGTVPGLINIYGTPASIFNPTGAAIYKNPREVIWNNGSLFMISAPIGIKFFLPPIPTSECCTLKGRVCVKFTFKDMDCKECEVVACFDFVLKK